MRNAIDNCRFQDDFAALAQRDAVLVAGRDALRAGYRSVSTRYTCQVAEAHSCLAHVTGGLIAECSTARAEERARANPAPAGTQAWRPATAAQPTRNKQRGGGKRPGMSFGGAGLMRPGQRPNGGSVRLDGCRPRAVSLRQVG